MLLVFRRNPPEEEGGRRPVGLDGEPLPLYPGGIALGHTTCAIYTDMETLNEAAEDGEYVVYEAAKSEAKDAQVPVPSSWKYHSEIRIKTPAATSKVKAL